MGKEGICGQAATASTKRCYKAQQEQQTKEKVLLVDLKQDCDTHCSISA